MKDLEYAKKTNRIALVTGITGQDGSYISEFLLDHPEINYTVHGIIRRSSSFNTSRIDHIYNNAKYKNRFYLHYGDLTDSTNLTSIINTTKPDEIYNLAAQSHVKVSFDMPEYTADVDAVGTLRLLDAVRSCNMEKKVRFYQASTSELVGFQPEKGKLQNEKTPFYPRSPYAVAKLFSYWMCINYRESYNMFVSNGILYNHESPRRGATFVTKKITQAAAKCYAGLKDPDQNRTVLSLGNLNSLRDFGHARDYVVGMWLMLQQDKPDEFILASGKQYSVREFAERTYKLIGLELSWKGEGDNEVGYDQNGIIRVKVDPKYYRPAEVDNLLGDANKAKETLGWTPSTDLDQLIKEMLQYDLIELGIVDFIV